MHTLYFDCYSGVSGDMILGALVDLGVDFEALRRGLVTLPIGEFALHRHEVRRCGIAATKVDVHIGHNAHGETQDNQHIHLPTDPRDAGDAPADSSQSTATGALAHRHHHGGPTRSYRDIERILEASAVSDGAREKAALAYRLLAEAEARVHGLPLDEVHFHEVGTADAIVDIVGSFLAMEMLGIEEVWSSEVTTGFGTVKTAHGVMPVPAPATAQLLAGMAMRRGDVEAERATPTGAAILKACARGFGPWPEGFRVERIGYGAGTREFPGQTNYLRAFLGARKMAGGKDIPSASADARSAAMPPLHSQVLSQIQTEIDDMPSVVYTHLLERLFALGCLDATLTPIHMKKNRPGVRIEVLCAPDRRVALIECLLRETTTFGVKVREIERLCLDRAFERVETPYGPVRIKIGFWGDTRIKASPEYEDCHTLAVEHRVALQTVMDAARLAFLSRFGKQTESE